MGDLKARNWRELIKPKNILVDKDSHRNNYGKFSCEPLERGFGITIGNSLRRIALASIRGAAIYAVKCVGTMVRTASGINTGVRNLPSRNYAVSLISYPE